MEDCLKVCFKGYLIYLWKIGAYANQATGFTCNYRKIKMLQF